MNAATIAMTPQGQLIHLDANGERDFSPKTQAAIRMAAAIFLTVLATLALGLMSGVVEPAPWSPMSQVHQEAPADQAPPAPEFDIPPGWEPAVPAKPAPGPGVAI